MDNPPLLAIYSYTFESQSISEVRISIGILKAIDGDRDIWKSLFPTNMKEHGQQRSSVTLTTGRLVDVVGVGCWMGEVGGQPHRSEAQHTGEQSPVLVPTCRDRREMSLHENQEH